MTQITNDHVEWAVVGRLWRMLEEPPHPTFNVTQTYAMFTTILCWVVQRIRIPTHEIDSMDDRIAHKLFDTLSKAAIKEDPWQVHVTPTERIEAIGSHRVVVPEPTNFETHSVGRFLINLRDATAHGDTRFELARDRCYLSSPYSGNSSSSPARDAGQTPRSVIRPVTSRAGVTSKA